MRRQGNEAFPLSGDDGGGVGDKTDKRGAKGAPEEANSDTMEYNEDTKRSTREEE